MNSTRRFVPFAVMLLLAAFVQLIIEPAAHGDIITISTFDHNEDGLASGLGADTTITENSPAATQGNAVQTFARTNIDQTQVTYLRFDLSATGGRQVLDARLRLYDVRWDEGSGVGNNRDYTLYSMTNQTLDNWGENAISWNSAPGTTDDSTAFNGPDPDGNAQLLSDFTFQNDPNVGAGWSTEMSIPGLVSFLNNDTDSLATLFYGVKNNAGSLVYFSSKEGILESRTNGVPVPLGSIAPQLILTLQPPPPIPEPSSLALVALSVPALACCIRRRRRRGAARLAK